MSRRGFVAVRRFTCPNHPEGPPTLPADGYDYEALTLEQAFEPEEVAALRIAVVAARICEFGSEASTVERMFGLCCAGHKWKIVGFRATTRSEETVSAFGEMLRSFAPLWQQPPTDAILLAELERGFGVEVHPGHPLPIRIPLVRGDQETSTDG